MPPTVKKKKTAKTSEKSDASPCVHCQGSTELPDVIKFQVSPVGELFVKCWHCLQTLKPSAVYALHDVNMRHHIKETVSHADVSD